MRKSKMVKVVALRGKVRTTLGAVVQCNKISATKTAQKELSASSHHNEKKFCGRRKVCPSLASLLSVHSTNGNQDPRINNIHKTPPREERAAAREGTQGN